MPVVCREIGLLFVMTPRTGSSAVGQALTEQLGGEYLPRESVLDDRGVYLVNRKHATVSQLLRHGFIRERDLESLHVVAGVRNPFDSLASLYSKKRNDYQPLLDDPDAWVHRIPHYAEDMRFCAEHSFDEWVGLHWGVPRLYRLLRRRRNSLFAPHTDRAHSVVRFESLGADMQGVLAGLGVAEFEIPRTNVTASRGGRDYRSYYSTRSRRTVAYRFARDFKRYGYRF